MPARAPDFLPETAEVRAGDWRVAPVPADLRDRRVEITGPVDRKMIINALNAPVQGLHGRLRGLLRAHLGEHRPRPGQSRAMPCARTISFADPTTGKVYRLAERTATLIVRPRGWHLPEKHVRIDGEPVSGALFDFALFFCQQPRGAGARAAPGPYFYLPKMESHLEARLWNDVFVAAQDALGIPRGTIKATVLIETILAAFEMDEILYELREHSAGLNCGRWDYIFSFIKKFRNRPRLRAARPRQRHDGRATSSSRTSSCSSRPATAAARTRWAAWRRRSRSATIPRPTRRRWRGCAPTSCARRAPATTAPGSRIRGSCRWRARPFDAEMKGPNQLGVLREDVTVTAADLLQVPEGEITEEGLRGSIRVGVQYLEAWLRGNGCVPLYNLMEDAATAEICRAQLWQWMHHGARTSDGRPISVARFDGLLTDELERIHAEVGAARLTHGVFPTAARLFEQMIKSDVFDEFLTLPAYELLS